MISAKKLFSWIILSVILFPVIISAEEIDKERGEQPPPGEYQRDPGPETSGDDMRSVFKYLDIHQETGPVLTIEEAIGIAVRNNPAILMMNEDIIIAEQDRGTAVSGYLPHLNYGLTYNRNDDHSAKGGAPLDSWDQGAVLDQVIFDDGKITDIREKILNLDIAYLNRDQKIIEMTYSTATAYFNRLEAWTIFKLKKEYLDIASANLESVRQRISRGQAGMEDVYRQEVEVENRWSELLEANKTVHNSRLELNKLMNKNLEERYQVKDIEIDDKDYFVYGGVIEKYVRQPKEYRAFADFMVEEGVAASPELEIFRLREKIQDILIGKATRSFFLPTISVAGGWTENINTRYGGDSEEAPPDSSGEDHWSAIAVLSFPIFSGGEKIHTLNSGRANYRKSRDELIDNEQNKELAIRRDLNALSFSYPNMQIKTDTAENARKNLSVVEERYNSGQTSILELADAQREYFENTTASAQSFYSYFKDLMLLEKDISRFQFNYTDEEIEAWGEKLRDYIKTNTRE
jgi:outer membrane protein